MSNLQNQTQELVQISESEINGVLTPSVSARDLHSFLESKRQFSDWIKAKIERLRLQENIDFVCLSQFCETQRKDGQNGLTKSTEYFVTIDIAKHIAMMENTDRGFEVRNYFIECEKRLKQVISPKQTLLLGILDANDELSRAVAINNYEIQYVKPLEKKVEEQAELLEKAKPKVNYCDIVLQSEDLMTITQISQDYPISNQKLNRILQEEGIQYKDKSGVWCLYVQYGAQGYAQTFTHAYQGKDGKTHAKLHLKWTQKGRLFIYDILKKHGISPIVEQEDYIPVEPLDNNK